MAGTSPANKVGIGQIIANRALGRHAAVTRQIKGKIEQRLVAAWPTDKGQADRAAADRSGRDIHLRQARYPGGAGEPHDACAEIFKLAADISILGAMLGDVGSTRTVPGPAICRMWSRAFSTALRAESACALVTVDANCMRSRTPGPIFGLRSVINVPKVCQVSWACKIRNASRQGSNPSGAILP